MLENSGKFKLLKLMVYEYMGRKVTYHAVNGPWRFATGA
jgi:hypothetical protein